jgi:two-component system alkaline phosphatase synthesis response regulator PhoP
MHVAKKILVIDNDPTSSRLMQYALTKRGYEVLIVSDGSDGLKKAREEGPSLVILSVMLPGMDGLEVCHRLRIDGDSLPIVMIAEKVREADRANGFKLGANEYLIKPVSPSKVVGVVDDLMILNSGKVGSAKLEKSIGY